MIVGAWYEGNVFWEGEGFSGYLCHIGTTCVWLRNEEGKKCKVDMTSFKNWWIKTRDPSPCIIEGVQMGKRQGVIINDNEFIHLSDAD